MTCGSGDMPGGQGFGEHMGHGLMAEGRLENLAREGYQLKAGQSCRYRLESQVSG